MRVLTTLAIPFSMTVRSIAGSSISTFKNFAWGYSVLSCAYTGAMTLPAPTHPQQLVPRPQIYGEDMMDCGSELW